MLSGIVGTAQKTQLEDGRSMPRRDGSQFKNLLGVNLSQLFSPKEKFDVKNIKLPYFFIFKNPL